MFTTFNIRSNKYIHIYVYIYNVYLTIDLNFLIQLSAVTVYSRTFKEIHRSHLYTVIHYYPTYI